MKAPDVHEAAKLLRKMREMVRYPSDFDEKCDLVEVDDFLDRYDAGYILPVVSWKRIPSEGGQ